MVSVTYFVVVPFERNEDGEFVMGKAFEVRSADSARFKVRLLAESGKGGVAFSRTGDPALGDFQEGEVLATLGELPERLETYLSR
ncbi:hypothetical protein GCM10007874_68350 [Labrys miyagiensis]|uniref:Uncharacterized protein n=1 Tax=Labrys miyagiensis TaxID=346912 RepID=A0ABQ6CUL7_9HYPH|nr:hypothetical protein [Labrys miyagiensis]GLS23814.1 hypothetical protein GCM10007874_68350 [Labrys miyagiensis]